MKSKKATQRALLSSLLSLLLCCSMLLGTTFAWFTDSVTSTGNIIKSGTLDVTMHWADGTEAVPANDSADWTDAASGAIFNYDRWEPGYTEVRHIKISNVGTLALKYQLGIKANGEVSKLTDVIDVYFADPAVQVNDRAALVDGTEIGTLTKILAGMPSNTAGTLEAGQSVTVTLALKMQEEAGNEYQNLSVGSDFAVQLLATQMEAESDSFGRDYDQGADNNEYVTKTVSTEEELVAALAAAKSGDVIGISGNVTWTTGSGHGTTPFVTEATNITLKGVGGNATFTATGAGVGPVGIDNGTVVFENLKIVDESTSYAEESWEFGYLEFRGTTVFKNCDVVNAIMMEGESAKFVDCSFNSNADNQYAVWVSDGKASFENCTFTGARGLKVHEAYGSEVVSVSVNNSTFLELSKKPGVAIGTVNADTAVSLTNNSFIGTQAGDQGNYKYESDTDVSTFSFVDKNNTVAANDGSLSAGLYQDEDGVYYATTVSGLNAGIDAAADGNTIVLAEDVVYTGNGYANITKDITLDLNGNNISTTSLGVVAKAGTIKNGTITNPVGSRAALRTWSGVSVENVIVVSPENGGITVASGNTLPSIKNVTIEAKTYGIELQYGACVGSIENVDIVAGKNGIVAQSATVGEIKNCTINGGESGVWAQLKGVYDLDISFTDNSVSGGSYGLYVCDEGASIVPDGVAKVNYDEATTFEGGVKDQEFAFGQAGKLFVNGAKIGAFISNADELFAFAEAVNEQGNKFAGQTVFLTADIDLNNAEWTPIGQTGATEFKGIFDGQNYTISNLKVDSSAQTGKNYSSGLFGWAESNVTIQNVKVDGASVTGNHNVAVIVGYTYSGKISNCHVANANITCKHANDDACGDKCGLIAGYAGDESKFTDCSASNSTVTAGRDAGQLIGAGYSASMSNGSADNVAVTATGECTGANINANLIGRVLG